MKIEQRKWTSSHGWKIVTPLQGKHTPQLVLVFGDRFEISNRQRYNEIRSFYPSTHIVSASTSGNIMGVSLDDDSIVLTAIAFEKNSSIEISKINISEAKSSYEAGEKIASSINVKDLVHVLILADGHLVNGSELVKGVLSIVPKQVTISGGLSGDGTRFEKTLVGAGSPPKEGEIVVVSFYGSHLKFGLGSVGGWDPFGMERKITRSKDNVLYELDGKSCLELYKKYLGDQAKDLPGSAMLFPLAIRPDISSQPIVRTILSIQDDNGMVFAGDVPEGWYAQLMKANFDRIIEAAYEAATASHEMLKGTSPDIAILISCVGRRIILDQRSEEEIERVQEVFGSNTLLTGFYSYGEIAPLSDGSKCELHNQTMTITTISEL